MTSSCASAAMIVLMCAAAGTALAQQQSGGPAPLPPYFAEPMPLHKAALGSFSRKISSSNADAQAYFDQGFQLHYSFAKYEAIRSFREAWKRDAECAMCYWGEALAWGSNLNQVITGDDSPHAYAAAQKALSLKQKAAPRERALIEALAQRYVARFEPKNRSEQDKAYARAMAAAYETYPDDLDIGTLYADALFHLEPRPGPPPGRRPRLVNVDAPNVKRIHDVLESLLARDPRHPGACHWYVHATEATAKTAAAQPCAEFLGASIPGASHINHMPSHTFNEVGRWGDSVRVNIEAWHSDLKAAAGEGFAIYPAHNLHMLVYAASMDGQGAIAMRAGKDYARLTGGDTTFQLLSMIRFGRFDEVLEITTKPQRDIPAGAWEFALGYAKLRSGQAEGAGVHLAALKQLAASSSRPPTSARVIPRRGCSECSRQFSKERLLEPAARSQQPSFRSSARWRSTTSSMLTSLSHCPSPRATGSVRRCSRRGGPAMPSASTAKTCGNTRTTGGRCSGCSSR